jgi:hypothetical protein
MCRGPESNCEHIQTPTACFRVITQPLRRAVRWRRPFSGLHFGEHPRACEQGNNSSLADLGYRSIS